MKSRDLIKGGYMKSRDLIKGGYMKSRDLIKGGYMKSRDLIKGGYAKFKSLVKYGKIKWKVLVDENFYTYVKIETNKQKNSQITLTSPSGKTYKKGKTGCIKIVNGAKENAETGKYVGEIKNGKRSKGLIYC
jgi:hypothetical protein